MKISLENKLSIDSCLGLLSEEFTPDELYSRVDITQYAQKLSEKAFFMIAEEGEITSGFIAYYLNKELSMIFITRIAVIENFRHQGIGRKMIEVLSCHYAKNFDAIELEVEKTNVAAQRFYNTLGFCLKEDRQTKLLMRKELIDSTKR